MFGIGAGEFALILIVGLIVFGPSKLPELGRSLGKLLREFKKAQVALSNVVNEVDKEPTKTASANPVAATPTVAAPATAANSETADPIQDKQQELLTTAQIQQPGSNSQSKASNPSIEQVTEMINSNPIKLTKESVEK